MITSIELTNFQCHKSLRIDCAPITTLVGPSDSGKSAVLRALRWICFNEGTASLYLKRGAEAVSASITIDDKLITRSSVRNSYKIDDMEFSAIGKTIPVEVSNILRVTDENIKTQFDDLYWFNCGGSALVSNLNKVVDLSKFEDWIREGGSIEKSYKADLNYGLTRKAELEASIEELKPYRDLDTDLAVLESHCSLLSQKQQTLSELIESLNKISKLEEQYKVKYAYVSDLSLICSIVNELEEKTLLRSQIVSLLQQGKQYSNRIKLLRDVLSVQIDYETLEAKQKQYVDLVSILKELDKDTNIIVPLDTIEELSEKQKLHDDLMGALVSLISLDKEHKNIEQNLQTIKSELEQKSGGICPICGGVLDVEKCCV